MASREASSFLFLLILNPVSPQGIPRMAFFTVAQFFQKLNLLTKPNQTKSRKIKQEKPLNWLANIENTKPLHCKFQISFRGGKK